MSNDKQRSSRKVTYWSSHVLGYYQETANVIVKTNYLILAEIYKSGFAYVWTKSWPMYSEITDFKEQLKECFLSSSGPDGISH